MGGASDVCGAFSEQEDDLGDMDSLDIKPPQAKVQEHRAKRRDPERGHRRPEERDERRREEQRHKHREKHHR